MKHTKPKKKLYDRMPIHIPDHKVISWNQLYSSPHWSKRQSIAREIHELVWVNCQLQHIKAVKKYPTTITIFSFQKGKLVDCSNICTKLYEDGLVEAGILEDDSPKYVEGVIAYSLKGEKDELYIYLTI